MKDGVYICGQSWLSSSVHIVVRCLLHGAVAEQIGYCGNDKARVQINPSNPIPFPVQLYRLPSASRSIVHTPPQLRHTESVAHNFCLTNVSVRRIDLFT